MQTPGTLQVKQRAVRLEKISLPAELDLQQAVLRQCCIKAGADSVEMEGSLDLRKLFAVGVDIALKGRFNTRANSFMSSVLAVSGGISDGSLLFDARLQGPLGPAVRLDFETRNLLLAKPFPTSVTGKMQLSFNRFNLEELEGSGNFLFTQPAQEPSERKPVKGRAAKGPLLSGAVRLKTGPGGTIAV